MSNPSSQSTHSRAARSKKSAPTQRASKSTSPAPAGPVAPDHAATRPAHDVAPAAADLEAQRALLADPATIATGIRSGTDADPTRTAGPARSTEADARAQAARPNPRRIARKSQGHRATRAMPTREASAPSQAKPSRSTKPSLPTKPSAAKPPSRASIEPAAAAAPAMPRAMSPATTTPPIARTALLDVTRAQRLAREARLRERDSREALARDREVLEGPKSVRPRALDEHGPSAPATPPPQWQRHALTPRPSIAHVPPPFAPPRATGIAPSTASDIASDVAPTVPPARERALAAELREARATLAIARETTQVQRDEIARLRTALAEPRLAPVSADPAPLLAELGRLRERVAQLEIDLEHREQERARLIETLAAGERDQAERSRQLAALQDRFDVQQEALEQARRQSELERRRHTEAQATLDRLRAALRGLEGEPVSPAPGESAPANEPTPPTAHVTVAFPGASDAPGADASASTIPSTTASPRNDGGSMVAAKIEEERSDPSSFPSPSGGLFRAPIFDAWRESQIRRHFGPLGLDTTVDLLREPLLRRRSAGGPALPVLVIGVGAAAKAATLSEGLVRGGAPRFVLHVADPMDPRDEEDDRLEGSSESPQRHAAPQSAAELDVLIRSVSPALIVLRDFLTIQREVESWLAALGRATQAGASLVLLEETGRGLVEPGDEIESIGQRIWELLPERYTRDPVTEKPVGSYREAFARRVAPPRNGLLGALRSRFELELCAQFGLLAEAFVAGPIAGCFDADAARDRRFLEQITDLDDRRVEAGNTAALHLIARVDPLAPR